MSLTTDRKVITTMASVTDREIEKLFAILARMEHTTLAIFGILIMLTLMMLLFTLVAAMHVILKRRNAASKRNAGYHKLFVNQGTDDEDENETQFLTK